MTEDILEQGFLQGRRWCEGTQTAGQEQPAPQDILLIIPVPSEVDQLG